jgi:CRISPR-associated endonuclease Cas1
LAPSHTVAHPPAIRQIPKPGVLVLHGFGIKVRVDRGHLFAEWGVGSERHQARLSRVEARKLSRVVLIGSDGYCTLEALRFISDDIGAAFVMLDKRGKALMVCGPVSPSDSKLRRAQSLSLGNGVALRISKELIRQKLDGQAALLRDMLHDPVTADAIARFRDELPSTESIERVRLIEAQAAKLYWQVWSDVPIRWPRKDERRIPEHWKRFNSRISPLTHSPRLACNPPNSLLSVLYALSESESRIALVSCGLDADVGLLHVDTPNRSSLACDLQEIVRPKIDAFVLSWIQTEYFRKSDWWEDRNGTCRMSTALAIRLCETSDTWRRFVAPVAEYVAQELWSSVHGHASTLNRRLIATRLTQRNKREVKGSEVPEVDQPKPEHVCSDCGLKIPSWTKLCSKCARKATPKNFRAGRKRAQQPEYLAKRGETMRTHRKAIQDWDPSALPAWLTRDIYEKRVVPALAPIPKSEIRKALGVSEPYSSDIRAGKCIPHRRHWQALARLVGVSQDVHHEAHSAY